MIVTKRWKYAMGWLPDDPDFRDYAEKTIKVKQVVMDGCHTNRTH
jgi:hypothetical protein